ncbi:hypothetical protein P3T16_003743 [Paraburkholderia sp. GAS42]|jgi:hypothetical protein
MRSLRAPLAALALGVSLLGSLSPAHALAPAPEPGMNYVPGKGVDWREEYAYAIGIQAYVFGYPWVHGATIRYQWITQNINDDTAYMPVDHFWHAPRLVTARWRDGGTPNNDTLYSLAWVDLSKEPLILHVPDTGERYYTIQLTGMDSDNFAYVGQRSTGNKAGNYAIVGPDWKGVLPKGVTALPPSPTPWALLWGRTLVNGTEDIPAAKALMHQYQLTPLSLWGKTNARVPERRDVWAPVDPATDPLAHWKTMNRAMTENPPAERDATLLKVFATIGIGPGMDVDKMDEPTRRGLIRAAREGWRILNATASTAYHMKTLPGGWRYSPTTFGRTTPADDFLVRGGLQSLIGLVANDPAESIYLSARTDTQGRMLDGDRRYVMHFAADQLPDTKAFWSMTLYAYDRNFIDNPIDRYSLGDRSPSLKKDADGGLTIYIQPDSPGADKEGNWLPSGKGNYFYLLLRTYIPGKSLLDQAYVPPGLTEVAQ